MCSPAKNRLHRLRGLGFNSEPLDGSMVLVLMLSIFLAQQPPIARELPVEVFQILELPIAVTDTVLVKTKNGYALKCVLSNSSEFRQLGLRYSLAVVDSMNGINTVITRSEGFRLAPYQTKSVTFKTPIKLNLKGEDRLVLILEQAVSSNYIWDVLTAEESLSAYIAGDYSNRPRVLRVNNQVDAPVRPRVVY